MGRRQIGVVGALWRYPVKSMRGEALDIASITQRGVAGDRAWRCANALRRFSERADLARDAPVARGSRTTP
jgi:uncharacterized protein YcbX